MNGSRSSASSADNKVSLSLQDGAEQIARENVSWSIDTRRVTEITYGFRASGPSYNQELSNQQSTFQRVTTKEIDAIRLALQAWSDVAKIEFREVNEGGYTDSATLLFGNYSSTLDGAAAFAFLPTSQNKSPGSAEGDVWLNVSNNRFSNPSLGSYDYHTIMHEIGHALGLEHPSSYNASPNTTITYERDADFREDTRQYTAMSYFDASITGASHGSQYAKTPLLLDVLAIQSLYGKNTTSSSDNDVYGPSSTRGPLYNLSSQSNVMTIWDSAGLDQIDVSFSSSAKNISLADGSFSDIAGFKSNLSIAVGTIIEDVKSGSGSDQITGNHASNAIWGGAGHDSVYGGLGNDRLYGEDGNDRLYGESGADQFSGGPGHDFLDGGSGSDVAIFSGDIAQFALVLDGSEFLVESRATGRDTLLQIEMLEFSNADIETAWFQQAASLSNNDMKSLTELYIASFNRAPDAVGLHYWGSRFSSGMTINEIASSFFVQPETVALYQSSDTTGFVTKVYQNVLNRSPDQEGFDYWINDLNLGRISKDIFLLAIINGAKSPTGSAIDRSTLSNKASLGLAFGEEKGLNNTTWAYDVMRNVTNDIATLDAALAQVDAYAADISIGITGSTPSSFMA